MILSQMHHITHSSTFPLSQLKDWFLNCSRLLPWRQNPTPYSVWISEIMLQQTQAQVVIAYFTKWMKEFPTIQALASSSVEKVLKIWEGLGYYSRARFIHEAAKEIMKNHNGEIPKSEEGLSKIKGIGPYTRGAILSFAFHQKAPAVDGNVLRLLSRYFAVKEPIDLPKTRKSIEELTYSILPDDSPWIIMEGLIELGAIVCKKKPQCTDCPIKESCLAFRNTMQHALPVKKKKQEITLLERTVAIIRFEDKFLLQRGEKGKVMADLHEFPYLEGSYAADKILSLFGQKLDLRLSYVEALSQEQHSFTRFRVKLFPHLLKAEKMAPHFIWKNFSEITELPFSSGHRRILMRLFNS